MAMPRVFGWTASWVLLLAGSAAADVLLLEDGRILEHDKMERCEEGVRVGFENGEVVIPRDMIREAILGGAPVFEPRTPEETAKAEKGLVPFGDTWVRKEKLADLIAEHVAERKTQIEEIRAHQKWVNRWQEKTKHFVFEYTVPPHIFEYYRDLMEAYYQEFAKTWKVKQPRELGRLTVCFYMSRRYFHRTGGARPGTLGYFRFREPLELNFYYDRLDPRETEEVMYHETNHYLQMLLNPKYSMPHFPGEAIAEYYGASSYDPKTKTLETGKVLEGRLAEIKMDVVQGDLMKLEKLLTTDGMYEHYNWGWSLAHFLMGDKRYRKKFEKFVKDLANGKNVKRVPYGGQLTTTPADEVWNQFRRSLGLKSSEDVEALEAEWHAYVKDGLQFVTSRGLEEAARRAANLGYHIKAKRLLKEAIEAGSRSARTYHRYADLLEGEHPDEAIRHYRQAVELAPLEATFYKDLGKALHRRGEKEEGLRLLKLALELDPDNVWLESEVQEALEDAGE